MSKGKMMLFNLGDSNKIASIVCSANDWYNAIRPTSLKIKCDTIYKGEPLLDGILDTKTMVFCPPDCGEMFDYKVWGTGVFFWESSICRAGL
jgi:hypothetical protein